MSELISMDSNRDIPQSGLSGDQALTETPLSEQSISDEVATALASALQKIEEYVPTQWVDNTEPDIDAEHLNHAEQAILRVTNLLNGAVDVINELQSQVDKNESDIGSLNGNLNAMTFRCENTSGNYGTLILNSEQEDPDSNEGSQIVMYGKGGNTGAIFNIDCFNNTIRIFYSIDGQSAVYNFKPDGIYINNVKITNFTQPVYSGDVYQLAPGTYYCTPDVINLPKSNIYFFVEIFNWENGNEKIIRATSTNEPNARHVYTNFFSGGSWKGWLMLV